VSQPYRPPDNSKVFPKQIIEAFELQHNSSSFTTSRLHNHRRDQWPKSKMAPRIR
jgi:hypothetical protein